MPLIEKVLTQLGKSSWFLALDIQSWFWQTKMVDEDIRKTIVIRKFGLFERNVMPFGLKNATRTFFQTVVDVFKD